MGMRFDKVPVDQWARLGNSLGNAYVQGQAADAGARASEQRTQTTSNFGQTDPSAVYQGDGADGAMTNAEAASYGVNTPKENAVTSTGTTRRYSLGDSQEVQENPYTAGQQRTASLRAQADFYANRGDTDRASNIESQLYRNDQQNRQRTQWREEDSLKADNREADEAAKRAYASYGGPRLSQVLKPQTDALGKERPQMSLASTTLAEPAAPATSQQPAPQPSAMQGTGAVQTMGKAGKPGMANSEAPDARFLAAMNARAEVFLKKGRMNEYKEAWMQTADLRAKVRANEFAAADKEYALTGDPTVYAKRIYPLIEDGHDFVSGKMSADKDGKPVLDLVRRNQDTGKDEALQLPAEQFLRTVEVVRNPAAVLATEAERAKKRYDTNEEIRKEEAKAAATAKEHARAETEKHKNNVEIERIRSENNIKETGVRLGGEAKNTEKRITLEQQAPRVLSEGQIVTVPQRRSDGSIEYVTAAKGASKNPTPVKDSDISNMVINNFGTDNPVSGRKTGNDLTARISAATRVIMKANPGLDSNQAMEAAAREVNKAQGAK